MGSIPREGISEARRLLGLMSGSRAFSIHDDVASPGGTGAGEGLREIAQFSLVVRQARCEHFCPAMFREPAWDLLLALYVIGGESGGVTLASLARDAGIPTSTALRWVDYLAERGLVDRQRSDHDRRSSTLSLSNQGRTSIEAYFSDVLAQLTFLQSRWTAANPSDAMAPEFSD